MKNKWTDMGDGYEVQPFTPKDSETASKWGSTWFRFRYKNGLIKGEASADTLNRYIPPQQMDNVKRVFKDSFKERKIQKRQQTVTAIVNAIAGEL